MSTAILHPAPLSRTTRQFGQAVGLSIAAVVLGCGLYAVESFLFRTRHKFIENPTEVMVRTLGLAHFLVGWLFLLTSTGMKSAGGVLRLSFWTSIGGLLCLAYAQGGAGKNAWMVLGFYSLFLVHEIRDQAELFLARADGPAACPGREAVVRWLCTFVIMGLLTLLLAGHVVHALFLRGSSTILRVDMRLVLAGLGSLTAVSLVAGLRFLQVGRRTYGSVPDLLTAFEPLLLVYLTLAVILLAGAFLGSGAFNLIILIHVMTWLVTVHHRLGPTPPAWPGVWHWLRRTSSGFLTLHLVVAGAILAFLAVRVHAWGRVGVISHVLSASSFPYWSLLHIAISFARRP